MFERESYDAGNPSAPIIDHPSTPALQAMDYLPSQDVTYVPHPHPLPTVHFERLEDTPIGPITIVQQDTDLIPYTAADLAELLNRDSPFELHRIVPPNNPSGKRLRYISDEGGLILRWNTFNHVPKGETLEGVVDRVAVYEAEVAHLKEIVRRDEHLKMKIPDRAVFIVERDEHHDNLPTAYTVVLSHTPSQPLRTTASEIRNPYSPIRTHIPTHLGLCATGAIYYGTIPHGAPFIDDESLTSPDQFAKDGTWLDRDITTATHSLTRAFHLLGVERWTRRLPPSEEREEVLDYIHSVPWRIPLIS